MKKHLIEIAYRYFPKNIDSRLQPNEYNASFEFRHLCETFDREFKKQQNGEFNKFYNKLESLDNSMYLHKYGLYIPNERAHNLQLAYVKENVLHSICLNISIIVPYYSVYVLETNIERFLKKPIDFYSQNPLDTFRNREMESIYSSLINKIRELTEQNFKITQFPEELINEVIPDINYNRIRLGEFTMFNAFFLNKYSARI